MELGEADALCFVLKIHRVWGRAQASFHWIRWGSVRSTDKILHSPLA